MNDLAKLLKNRNVQYFLLFGLVLLTMGFTVLPLVDANPVAIPTVLTPTNITTSSSSTTQEATAVAPNVAHVVTPNSSTAVQLYAAPNAQNLPTAELAQGQVALLLQTVSNDWYQVQYNGTVAWVQSKDVIVANYLENDNGTSITIYQEANTSSRSVGTIPPTAFFFQTDPTSVTDRFMKVHYDHYDGYIDTTNLAYNYAVDQMNTFYQDQANIPQTLTAPKTLVTKLDSTPLYQTTDATGATITTVSAGTLFSYEDREGDYYKVTTTARQTAYIPYWLVVENFASIESDATLPQGIANAKIVLDPGHGGSDPGAVVDFSNLHEADHTLSTALLVKQELEAMGATVVMTRSTDTSVSLAERAGLSNREQADAFISLHFDSAESSNVSGTTAYFFSPISQNLALTVNKYIAQRLPITSQGTRFQNYMMLRENHQPSMLLELGYLNSPKDNKLIESKEYQQQIAHAIADALKEYFQ